MALFRRSKAVDGTVPEEVNQYYQAENRERTWMAWLLALVSLAVTALVVMALFFGGRWIYRKVRHQSASKPVATQKVGDANSKDDKSDINSPSSAPTPQNSDTGTVKAPTNPSTPATSTNTTPKPPAQTPTPTTPPAVASNGLPNTGPGDVIAIFALISTTGAIVYRYVLRPLTD